MVVFVTVSRLISS